MQQQGCKVTRFVDAESMETPENGCTGTRASASEKAAGLMIQLMCLYTNACSKKNKQEKLKSMMQQENFDIAAITET